jgi:hypothetical protein
MERQDNDAPHLGRTRGGCGRGPRRPQGRCVRGPSSPVNDIIEVGGILQFTVALWIDSGVGMELIDLGDLNPIRVVNPPILVDDPAGDIVREWNDPQTGLPQTRTLREDLDAVLLQIAAEVTAKFEGTGGQM